MLTTASSREEREAYLLKNLKFVDDWLRLDRPYEEISRTLPQGVIDNSHLSLGAGAFKSV